MENQYYRGLNLILLNIAIGLGTFIQVLDTSIANVALPYIAGNLNVSSDEGVWVITSFAASNAIVLPLTGWLSTNFGSVRLFVCSLLLFSLVSFFCGLSGDMTYLVIMRTIQGAVAGALVPLSQALLLTHNPPSIHGLAMGFWIIIVIIAPILGPIVGGYLTEEYSWPWIFYINVPIGAFSAFVTWQYLKNSESPIRRTPVDWIGLILLTIGVGALQIMLDKGEDLDWFESNIVITLTIVSIISLIYFVVWNRYQKYPLVDFKVFRSRNFAIGTAAVTIGYMLYFGSSVTVPLWLQTQQMYTAYWAGLAIAPIGFIPVLVSLPLGAIMSRIDIRKLSVLSFLFFGYGFYLQSTLTTQLSLGEIMYIRFIQGFGVAIFFLPLFQISLSEISKEDYSNAAGLLNFFRILFGSGFGTSVTVWLWRRFQIFHHSRLAESLNDSRSLVTETSVRLEGLGLTQDQVHSLLDFETTRQAYMLSTNDISWLGSILFVLMAPLIMLCRKVKSSENSVAGEF